MVSRSVLSYLFWIRRGQFDKFIYGMYRYVSVGISFVPASAASSISVCWLYWAAVHSNKSCCWYDYTCVLAAVPVTNVNSDSTRVFVEILVAIQQSRTKAALLFRPNHCSLCSWTKLQCEGEWISIMALCRYGCQSSLRMDYKQSNNNV